MSDFIAIDFETTGFMPPQAEIIEIGAVHYCDGIEVAAYEKIVRPLGAVPIKVLSMTGIHPTEFLGAPLFSEVATEFMAFLGENILVAHQASFERRFLFGRRFEFADTLTMARARMTLPNYKLRTVAEALGYAPVRSHRALDDARCCGAIYLALREMPAVERKVASKEDTASVTLTFFREGHTIEEIAAKRGLAVGSIEKHIEELIARSHVRIHEVVTQECIMNADRIWNAVGRDAPLKVAFEKCEGRLGYKELRFVRAALNPSPAPP